MYRLKLYDIVFIGQKKRWNEALYTFIVIVVGGIIVSSRLQDLSKKILWAFCSCVCILFFSHQMLWSQGRHRDVLLMERFTLNYFRPLTTSWILSWDVVKGLK